MTGEIVTMTPWQYFVRWTIAGLAFTAALALVLWLVVTRPILDALAALAR